MDPNIAGRSPQIERCVHSLVIMLQVFAPNSAAEFWNALSIVPKIQTDLWNSDDIVCLQRWPQIDQDAHIEFVLRIFNTIVRAEAQRDSIESLELDELIKLAREKYHKIFFEQLENADFHVENYILKKRPGLRLTLNMEMDENFNESDLRAILGKLSSLRNQNKKSQKIKPF